jgi:FtsZ-binding cell division protein ZapB
MATLEQQVRDVAHDVDTLAPVQMAVVRIEEQVRQVRTEVTGVREAIADERKAVKEAHEKLTLEMATMRREAAENDLASSRQLRNGVIAIVVAVITAAGGIIAAAGSPV